MTPDEKLIWTAAYAVAFYADPSSPEKAAKHADLALFGARHLKKHDGASLGVHLLSMRRF